MKFLGFDCAVKTFAYTLIDINTNINEDIGNILDWCEQLLTSQFGGDFLKLFYLSGEDSQKIKLALHQRIEIAFLNVDFLEEFVSICFELNKILKKFMTIISSNVIDLIPGKKIDDISNVEITKKLRAMLDGSDINNDTLSKDTLVIIECQPIKVKSRTSNNKSIIISHNLSMYYSAYEFDFIDPKLKNNICLGNNLSFGFFLEKYKHQKNPKSYARKMHTRANMEFLVKIFNFSILDKIKKSVYDDQADSLIEIFAYIAQNKLFNK